MTPKQIIGAGVVLPYHLHDRGYVAVVLEGGYLEAAENGRFSVERGWAVFHPPFQPHFDCVRTTGAVVLNLPAPACASASPWAGELRDPGRVAGLAARDPEAALGEVLASVERRAAPVCDWPDLLARDLSAGTIGGIGDWASNMGLSAEAVSRGFLRCYGASPTRFRADARARRALTDIIHGETSLATVAQERGYSDQAHMTRSITRLTGRAPGAWRRRSRTPADADSPSAAA